MNNQRRGQIYKAIKLLKEASSFIDKIRTDEEDYMNSIPENLQNSDRYYAAEEAVSNMEDAISSIEDAIDSMDDASI